jgi:hypothetical protein
MQSLTCEPRRFTVVINLQSVNKVWEVCDNSIAVQLLCFCTSCGICGGQSGAGAGFHRVLLFPLPIFIPPISPQSPSPIIRGWYNRPVGAAALKAPQYKLKKCGICGRQSGTGSRFSVCHIHHLTSGAGTISQLVAEVPIGLILTPSQKSKLTAVRNGVFLRGPCKVAIRKKIGATDLSVVSGGYEDMTWAREAEESLLLEAVARKHLMKTQQAGKGLSVWCGDRATYHQREWRQTLKNSTHIKT